MKQCKDLSIVSFDKALKWIKSQNPTENNPVYISKYGGRSDLPFRVWCFANALLLMSNEHSIAQTQYILCKSRWNSFIAFIRQNPEMKMGELASNYKRFGCGSKVFWPAIISISKAFEEDNR